VIEQEESYTSKSDSLALDFLPVFKKENKVKYTFSGRRKKRGLYQSSIKKIAQRRCQRRDQYFTKSNR
jgi:hypothetical protein